MSLVPDARYEDVQLRSLKRKVAEAQDQLDQLTRESTELRNRYQKECPASLGYALTGLIILCGSVGKADKRVVFWYEEGRSLRIMLKPLGINKATSAIVERKTTELRTKAAVVKHQFESTGKVCKEALSEAQSLNQRVNEYSKSTIGNVQQNNTGIIRK
jgi:hypothetical protein